jgi:hypothetical protein
MAKEMASTYMQNTVQRWCLGLQDGQGGPSTDRKRFSLEGAAATAFSDFSFFISELELANSLLLGVKIDCFFLAFPKRTLRSPVYLLS